MPCSIELNSLPIIQGCPSDNELFLVFGAIGGSGASLAGLRRWSDLKHCITFTVISPYIGVVDRGNPNDPISGTGTFTNALLAGLGTINSGQIQIVLAEVLRSNFGNNASFTYTDNVTIGTIVISNNAQFLQGDTLYIDRNK